MKLGFQFRGKRFDSAAAGLNAFSNKLAKSVKDFNPVIQREMRNMLDTVVDALRQRHSTSWQPNQKLPSGAKTGRLAKRSGKMLADIEKSIKVSGMGLTEIRGEIAGPRIHEQGGRIRPKGKFLAIPLPAALNANGTPKKRRARDWRNTFVTKSKRGNLLIFQKKGAGKIVPLYVLKTTVLIPQRLGLNATLEAAAPVFVDRVFNALLRQIIKEV